MTLASLKSLCAAYHLKSTGDLTVNGVDLFLAAANNARRAAEQLHDFEFTRISATLDIDGDTGGALSAAVIANNNIDHFTATGTLSPDATGTYIKTGTTYNSLPTYLSVDGTSFYLLYYNGSTAWEIQLMFNFPAAAKWFKLSTATTPPTGAYTATGGVTGTLTLAYTASSFATIKQVTNVLRTSADGQVLPIDFKSMDSGIEGTRTEIEVSDYYSPDFRYPSDATFLAMHQGSLIVQRNRTLYIYPQATVTTDPLSVTLEGYGWLSDYDANSLLLPDAPDFLFEQGPDYFQWAIICELNFLFKTFVPRSEGNIGAPENLRADALRKLIIWDSYQIAANSTASR